MQSGLFSAKDEDNKVESLWPPSGWEDHFIDGRPIAFGESNSNGCSLAQEMSHHFFLHSAVPPSGTRAVFPPSIIQKTSLAKSRLKVNPKSFSPICCHRCK